MSTTTVRPTSRPTLISLEKLREERTARSWRNDCSLWMKEKLGEHPWSLQRRICDSVRDHRKTAVPSSHGPGKSFISARIACWWIYRYPPGTAFVVTSATTGEQVKIILWKEIGRAHAKAGLWGKVSQAQWKVKLPGQSREEVVAIGRKPSEYNPTAFQGIHARRVLVIFDEAGGIPGGSPGEMSLWDSADALLTNDECRMLAIGNPDVSGSEFERVCRPGSDWSVIPVSSFDTPNFTGERVPNYLRPLLVGRIWVEEKRKLWAPNWHWTEDGSRCVPPASQSEMDANPLWLSKVLGKFPKTTGAQCLIPIPWVEEAQKRSLARGAESEFGVDVGGGGDSSTIAHRLGAVVRIVHEDHVPDTMHTCGVVIDTRRRLGGGTVKVDMIGIGRGVVDRANEQGEGFQGIQVGEAPICNCEKLSDRPHHRDCNTNIFANLRAQYWWEIRTRFEQGEIDIDPEDRQLAAELCDLRFKRTSSGKIQIESKADAKRRGVSSPNRADALMLAFAQSPDSCLDGRLVL